VAAGVLGLATQQEVANLRTTIQQLEDTVSTLEAKTAAARTPPAP
jgi:polyhydroxyalkanoate synthesis regulator phasin